ncbi:MAG TPA: twin-arginine translocase TatA/TatE family subunit [Mycobacteriales bacterium]
MLRGGLEWWHIVILLVVLFALFGYKKLPSATKSVAQSLKIFRDETKGLRGGHDEESPASAGEHVSSIGPGSAAIPAPAPAPVTVPAAPPQEHASAQVAEPAAVAAPAPNAGTPAGAGQSLAPRPKSR